MCLPLSMYSSLNSPISFFMREQKHEQLPIAPIDCCPFKSVAHQHWHIAGGRAFPTTTPPLALDKNSSIIHKKSSMKWLERLPK